MRLDDRFSGADEVKSTSGRCSDNAGILRRFANVFNNMSTPNRSVFSPCKGGHMHTSSHRADFSVSGYVFTLIGSGFVFV